MEAIGQMFTLEQLISSRWQKHQPRKDGSRDCNWIECQHDQAIGHRKNAMRIYDEHGGVDTTTRRWRFDSQIGNIAEPWRQITWADVRATSTSVIQANTGKFVLQNFRPGLVHQAPLRIQTNPGKSMQINAL